MESIIKVDLYEKNSIVDSTVPPTPEFNVGMLGLDGFCFSGTSVPTLNSGVGGEPARKTKK